jgi:hypothetical protein
MQDVLVDHALRNVWCTPDGDNQMIFKPARLTENGGVINRYKLNWDYIPLPEKNKKYHLYHIGQVHPSLINFFNTDEQWVSLTNACHGKYTLINVYTNKGIELPRFDTFYYITKTNNIVLAISKNNKINFDFDLDDLFVRTYRNAFYASDRAIANLDGIFTEGLVIRDNNDILNIQSKILAKQALSGITNCFINGYKVSSINLTNCSIGDYVEYIHDTSVKKTIDFDISNLPVFDSILDQKGKYLLHYSGLENVIDYQDDIDLYLIDQTGKGVYVHKNNKDTLRNLTHKDYSVVVSYIHSYLDHFKDSRGALNINNIKLRLIIRKSGWDRPLILEKNRINELYKLPESKIIPAMVGVNSTVDVWRAANLEQCEYVQLMSKKYGQINNSLVCQTYGFDAISKLFSDTPIEVTIDGVNRFIRTPLLLKSECTAFEYNDSGNLIDWYSHTGEIYICKNINARYVEVIKGIADRTLDETYGVNSSTLNKDYTYRFYCSDIVNSVVQNNWSIASSDKYSIANNILTWNTNKYTLVRSNKKFLCYKELIPLEEGVIEIGLDYYQNRNNSTHPLEMQIPLGELDVFLNGRILVENIDYYFDCPKLIIVNKSYIDNTKTNQEVVIRFTGHCNDELQHNGVKDIGFVQRGRISDNHYYNIKDGKVQRIVIGGGIKTVNQISYFEETNNGTVFNSDNGKPYFIRDYVTPIKSITGLDDYLFKEESNKIDKKVSDYISTIINQISAPDLSVNPNRHYLYSPFLARVLNELIDGGIDTSLLGERYTDDYVRQLCLPFEELLQYDPINIVKHHYKDYVVIHPHIYNNVVNLDFNRFKFFSKVNELYSNGRVDLVNQIRLV